MKWEYLYETYYPNEQVYGDYQNYLNVRGDEGWELVETHGRECTFKRPKQE